MRLQALKSTRLMAVCLSFVWTAGFVLAADAQPDPSLKKLRANGVELHYLDRGKGVPIVFVHGGLVDYRRWADQIEPFAQKYRVISYSRRYNFPNRNPRVDPAYSAAVDAEDLAALIKKLRLGRVHVIGESYGAFAAMILAARHPELVRSLVLAEAPMLRWLNASPEGKIAYDDFQNRLWGPVGRAFKSNDKPKVLEIVADFFLDGAKIESLPPEAREMIEANLREWQALSQSPDAFPSLSREEVASIQVPVMLMEGEKTLPLNRILDAQYAAILPHQQTVVIASATHEMWDEQPAACREKSLEFLAR